MQKGSVKNENMSMNMGRGYMSIEDVQLYQSRMSGMNNDRNLYFEKSYRLLIHSISFKSKINVSTYSEYASRPQQLQANQTIYIDSVIDVCVIDVVNQTFSLQAIGQINQLKQKQVQVTIFKLQQGRKIQLATCFFDMNLEKIVKEQSKQYMKANLGKGKEGYVEYKFISLRTRQVNFQDFEKQIELRNGQMKFQLQAEEDSSARTLRELIQQKNNIIDVLEKKMHELTHELSMVKKQSAGRDPRDLSIDKGTNKSRMSNKSLQKRAINLNVKVTPSDQHIQHIVKEYKQGNQKLQRQLEDLKKQNSMLQKDNELLRQEIQLLKRPVTPEMKESVAGKTLRVSARRSKSRQSIGSLPQDNLKISNDSSRSGKNLSVNSASMKQSIRVHPHPSIIQQLQDIAQQKNPQNQQSRQVSYSLVGQAPPTQQGPSINIYTVHPSRVRWSDMPQSRQTNRQALTQTMPRTYEAIREKNEKLSHSMIQPVTQNQYDYLRNQMNNNLVEEKAQAIIDRMKQQTNLLNEKLKLKDQQIFKLKQDLEYYTNRVKQAQKNVQDIRETSRSMHLQRLQQIKAQRADAIKELHGASRNAPSVEYILYKERVETQLEKLRFEISTLREKNRELTTYKAAQDQREKIQLAKLNRENSTLRQEKTFFQTKYNDIAEKYSRATQENKRLVKIQKQHQDLKGQFAQVSLQKHSAQQKLQQTSKLLQQHQAKVKTLSQRLQQRQGQWSKLKMLQQQFQPLKKKNFNLQKMNRNQQQSLNQIKKYANKLQGIFHEIRRQTGKKPQLRDKSLMEDLQKQFKEKLDQIKGSMGQMYKEMFESQREILEEYKKNSVEEFRKKYQVQIRLIQQGMNKTNEQTRTKLKLQKQKQINSKKDKRIQQLQNQIKRIQQKRAQIQQSSQKYDKASLVDKIKQLQKSLKLMSQQKKQWKRQKQQLKLQVQKYQQKTQAQQQQLQRMKQSTVKSVSEVSNAPDKRHQAITSRYIEQSMSAQRKNLIDQLNRSKDFYGKALDQLKKTNAQLMKAKNQVEIQLQNVKFRQQKGNLKLTQDVRNLQRKLKHETEERGRQAQRLNKRIEMLSGDNERMKGEIVDLEEGLKVLTVEIEKISTELEKKVEEIIHLEDLLKQREQRLIKYEQAQKLLLKQVQNIRQQAEFAQKEFGALLTQRNQQFMKIQTAKSGQILKLNNLIAQYQTKLQEEMMQTLNARREVDQLVESVGGLQTRVRQLEGELEITKEEALKSDGNHREMIEQLQRQNTELQRNLIELAQQIGAKEKVEQQLSKRIQLMSQQINVLNGMHTGFITKEKQYQQQKSQLQLVISQQQQQLSHLKQTFDSFQKQVQSTAVDYDNTLVELQKLRQSHQQLQQEYRQKDRRVMQLQVRLENFQGKIKEKENELFETVKSYQNKVKEKENQVEEMKIRVSQLPPSQNFVKVRKLDSIESYKSGNFDNKSSKDSRKDSKKQLSFDDIKSRRSSRSKRSNRPEEQRSKSPSVKKLQTQKKQSKEDQMAMFKALLPVQHIQQDQLDGGKLILGAKQSSRKQSEIRIEHSSNQNSQNYGYRISDPNNNDRQYQQQSSIPDNQQDGSQEFSRQESSRQENEHDDERFFMNKDRPSEQSVRQLLERIAKLEEENEGLQHEIVKLSDLISSHTGMTVNNTNLGLNSTEQSIERVQQSEYSANRPTFNKLNRISTNQRLQTQEQESLSQGNRSQKGGRSDKGRSGSQDKFSQGNSASNTPKQRKYSDHDIKQLKQGRQHNRVGSEGYVERPQDSQEKIASLQLAVQELQVELTQVKAVLQEERQGNERLMAQLNEQMVQMQLLQHQLQQKQSTIQQLNQQHSAQKQLFQQKIEQIVNEMLQKQSQLATVMKQLEEYHKKFDYMEEEMQKMEEEGNDKMQEVERMREKLEANRGQFRKYEEEAQLEILSLKEKIDQFAVELKEKYKELEAMADKYLALEQEKRILSDDIEQYKTIIDSRQAKYQSDLIQMDKISQQLVKTDQQRRRLLSMVQQTQAQKLHMQATLTQMNKSFSMALKKHSIQIQSYKQHIQQLKSKIQQKDEHLVRVKGEISLYNQECDQLKRINNTLNLELQKVQKSLKDIMVSYQAEEDQLAGKISTQKKKCEQLEQLMKEKDDQLVRLGKQMRTKDKELDEMRFKLGEVNVAYERFKTAKMNEVQQYIQKYSYKEDEYEKLRLAYEKAQEQWFNQQCGYLQSKQKTQNQLRLYKQKLTKYQTAINDLSTQILKQVQQRPTKQAHDQIVFQNQMYKNRIKQLEQIISQKDAYVPPNISEQVCLEYRRYKIAKESQLGDLEQEIQKYCGKVMELEENNYELRKEIDGLRTQLIAKVREVEELKEELQTRNDELSEAKSQMEFYQRKRTEQLNKLLNETFQ